ncbi:hypothetical protein C8Q77DRAFT_1022930, partial [Trametes polyzona]
LRIAGAVISGSVALNVLASVPGIPWCPGDLDIYCPMGQAGRVVKYLINCEHYAINRCSSTFYSRDAAGISIIVKLCKGSTNIDVIQSATPSALHPLPFFWATHLMNFLSATSFCIAYPSLTSNARGLLNPISLTLYKYPHKRTLDVLRKYGQRGYDFR